MMSLKSTIALIASAALVQANSEAVVSIFCANGQGTIDTNVIAPGSGIFGGGSGCSGVGVQPYSNFQIKSLDIEDDETCFIQVYDFNDKSCSGNTIFRIGPFKKGDAGTACHNIGTDPITGAHDNGGSVILSCS